MTGIAMLGMYDMPGVNTANDALWSATRANLGRGPMQLTRNADYWDMWRAPDLVLGQTCGYPYRAKLHGNVQIVATPDYGLPDCPEGYYRSVFVARKDSDIRELDQCAGRSFAFNDTLSQSGWAAPQQHLLQSGLQAGSLVQTGGHALSLEAVAAGKADFAAVDMQTLILLQNTGAYPNGLQEIARTDPSPGLPYICSLEENAGAIRAALASAIDTSGTEALGLRGLARIPDSVYLSVPTPPSPDDTKLPLRQPT